ncbi:hypothetical protein H6G81_02285 [Scytonema hofmannii FACHB-248]|uniref:RAMP superfamily protein n=1 Tax=Scytonema hofmannii FACHB-248 TaxID=1842502 RepID=A0ABR8GJ28_9CYAN|nr:MULTISPECIES: hypothetical protein [Nostocales]MBD2603386.1 hypothetical protein [Scytonema hofmannii FACHB-248]
MTQNNPNNNANEVPLMFQAQISGRGQTQYIGDTTNIKRWVKEWKEGAENQSPTFISQEHSKIFQTKKYKITWRIVSNSGQDEDIIRPVIAAGGFPYYPGASMKGAFLRACTPEQKKRYCGGNTSDNQTQPGILRFHGGYPQDDTWKETELVDVIHPQQDWQVKENNHKNHSAFLQISLYQPTLIFGISSTIKLKEDETEWNTIWGIWEKALEKGIGCRVSAGYGQPVKHPETKLVTVGLSGQGLASKLIDDVGEFRPNMFKAALRGHTLRLFSGVTNEQTAEELTRELWGGFADKNAVVGLLGIAFNPLELDIDSYRYNNSYMPTYELTEGVLNILCLRQVPDDERDKLKKLAIQLVKFSMLLGGFGKSWRRVDHRLVFEDYLEGNRKPMIGCHWEFVDKSKNFYISIRNLNSITNFLNFLDKSIKEWVESRGRNLNYQHSNWREVWHPQKVEVWARIAEDITDSEAVKWFHGNYEETNSIKSSVLTGKMSQIGRIWHRMYPRYIKPQDGDIKRKGQEFIEILTIFPDNSDKTCDFLDFLDTDSNFTQVWKPEEKV